MSNSSSVPVGTTLKQVRQHAYRKVILDAAERVFADYGYDAARVQTIAAAAGASVGTIYGVFGSKAELFNAVLTLRLDDVTALASEAGDDLEFLGDPQASRLGGVAEQNRHERRVGAQVDQSESRRGVVVPRDRRDHCLRGPHMGLVYEPDPLVMRIWPLPSAVMM